MNCLFSGAITRIGGAQKRAGGVASVKYSVIFDTERIVLEAWEILGRREKFSI